MNTPLRGQLALSQEGYKEVIGGLVECTNTEFEDIRANLVNAHRFGRVDLKMRASYTSEDEICISLRDTGGVVEVGWSYIEAGE